MMSIQQPDPRNSIVASRVRAGKTVWAAGAFDALSARMIEAAGFDAVMTSGFGISSSFLGQPDAEYYTMTENLAVVRNVLNATRCPVIADIDTGYGNPLNVIRTVREFEQAGATALIMEDQVSPKRCPCSSDSIEVLPLEEAVAKIEAAVEARRNPEMLLIARTDAIDPEEAVRRGRAYAAAGADLVQPISKCFRDFDGLKRMREVCGKPLSLQLLGWLESDLEPEQIESVAGLAVFPLVALMSVAHAMQTNLNVLAQKRSSRKLPLPVMGHDAFSDFIGFPEVYRLEMRYLKDRAR